MNLKAYERYSPRPATLPGAQDGRYITYLCPAPGDHEANVPI